MIFTRLLARQVRRVFEAAVGRGRRGAGPPLRIEAGPEGIDFWAGDSETAVAYHLPGDFEPERLTIPLAALKSCEGGRQEPVRLAKISFASARLEWEEAGLPQAAPVPVLEGDVPFPPMPANWFGGSERLLPAVAAAIACTDAGSSRFALGCLQWTADGSLVATDGRQLLVQSGFSFPWEEDLLAPASRALGCREWLQAAGETLVGRTNDQIVLRRGPWTLALAIQKEVRFPSTAGVIPAYLPSATQMSLAESDADFLERSMRHLPAASELNEPVTLEANGSLAVRARGGEGDQGLELVLDHSQRTGPDMKVCVNRAFFKRALQLGFRHCQATTPAAPLLWYDAERQYVFAALSPEAALASHPAMPRVGSSKVHQPRPLRTPHRKNSVMAATSF